MKRLTKRTTSLFFAMILVLGTLGTSRTLAEAAPPSLGDFTGTALGEDAGKFTWSLNGFEGYSIDSTTATLNEDGELTSDLTSDLTVTAGEYVLNALEPNTNYSLNLLVNYSKSEVISFSLEKEEIKASGDKIYGRDSIRGSHGEAYYFYLEKNEKSQRYDTLDLAFAAAYPGYNMDQFTRIEKLNNGDGWERYLFDISTYKANGKPHTNQEAALATKLAELAKEYDKVGVPTITIDGNKTTYSLLVSNSYQVQGTASFITASLPAAPPEVPETPADDEDDKEETPAVPPTAPAPEEPGAPTPEAPTAPEEPAAPAPEEPAAPAPEEPATPAPEEPAAPTPEEPAAPAPEEPAAPASEEPAAPASEEPAAPAPEEPATPAPEEPATPAPTAPAPQEPSTSIAPPAVTETPATPIAPSVPNVSIPEVVAESDELIIDSADEDIPEASLGDEVLEVEELVDLEEEKEEEKEEEEVEIEEDILDETTALDNGITELPDTSGIPTEIFTLAGTAFVGLGLAIKKRK